MLITVIFCLLFLTVINYFLKRSILYPPFVYSALWTIFLFFILLLGDQYYNISGITLLIYLVGAFAFSLGGLIFLFTSDFQNINRKRELWANFLKKNTDYTRRLIDIFLVILVIAIPFYWNHACSLADAAGIDNFWHAIRYQSLISVSKTQQSIGILENMVPLSIIVTLITFLENDGTKSRRFRFIFAFILTLILNLLTAARSGIIGLLIAITCLHIFKSKKINPKILIIASSFFIGFFFLIAQLMGKGKVDADASFIENIPALFDQLIQYSMGGIIGFDKVATDPNSIPSVWSIWRYFWLIALKLGANIEVPSRHVVFTQIGDFNYTNVYTIYFSYFPDYGWVGVIILPFLIGFIVTWFYRTARGGNPYAIIFYALMFRAMVFSGFSENFFLELDFYIKTFLFMLLLYRFNIKRKLFGSQYS